MADDILDRRGSFATRAGERPERQPDEAADEPSTTETAADQGAQQMAISEAHAGAAVAAAGGTAPGRAGSSDTGRIRGGLAPAGVIRACPIPAGAVIFGELTSAFVDGASLIRYLAERRHTGAVIDAGRSRVQVALLHEGQVVGLISVADGITRRIDTLSLPAPGTGEEHQLTVLTYRPEITLALAQLVNTPERFDRMHASFVDLPALLAFLRRERADGAVRLTTPDDAGVILLRGGEVLGAYTRHLPELDDEDVVLSLSKAPDAEVDVCIGPLTVPPPSIPVSSIL
jgi:hypothetical protein